MEQMIDGKILERLNQIQIDIEIIRELLPEESVDCEGELSELVIEETARARGESEEDCVSLDDLRKEIEDEVRD